MKFQIAAATIVFWCAASTSALRAQSQPPAQSQSNQGPPAQSTPPAASKQAPGTRQTNSNNPFPEDETTVPVMPNRNTINQPADLGTEGNLLPLPGSDIDPVHSPDADVQGGASGSSSSLAGIDDIDPDTDTGNGASAQPSGRHGRKHGQSDDLDQPEHQETAAEDENVGKYYLDSKDWKGALSRFESALVLDPYNPDVYWGLAESERHLGRFADARGNYQKVVEYDPGSHHAKEASKALKEPEIANAAASAAPPVTGQKP